MVPLKELLKERFGSDFPVDGGSTHRDDPLVITDQRDYVAIEYTVAKFLLGEMGLDYKFEKQRVRNLDGQVIDELFFATKESGAPDWTQRRSFFFDITLGYGKTHASHPYEGFKLAASETGVVFGAPSSKVLRDELLGFAQQNFRDGTTPKSHLYVSKGDGSRFIFQVGKLDLTAEQRDDFIRYVLFIERAAAYAHSFRVGVDLGGGIGVVERLAVFSADRSAFAAGELTLNSKDKGGAGNKLLEATTPSPFYEFQKMLDGAFVRKKRPLLQRLLGAGDKDDSVWKDEWNRLRAEVHWLRARQPYILIPSNF
jgi:hypothetical protein